jgi:hypothetical protein
VLKLASHRGGGKQAGVSRKRAHAGLGVGPAAFFAATVVAAPPPGKFQNLRRASTTAVCPGTADLDYGHRTRLIKKADKTLPPASASRCA